MRTDILIIRLLLPALLTTASNYQACYGKDLPSALELTKRAVRYRADNCNSGKIDITTSDQLENPPIESKYAFRFNNDSLYQSVRSRAIGTDAWSPPSTHVLTKNRIVADELIKSPVKLMPRSMVSDPSMEMGISDPRVLGLVGGGMFFLHRHRQDHLLKNTEFCTHAKVAEVNTGGMATYKANHAYKNGHLETIWFSPAQGDGILRIEYKSPSPDGEVVENTEFELKQYANGIWYPGRCIHTVVGAGAVSTKHVVEVNNAEFGPVDDSMFTMTSMSLEPGREVTDYTSGTSTARIWNGKEAVEPWMIKETSPTPAGADSVGPSRRVVMLSLSLALLAAGIILLARKVYRRRR